MGADNHPGSPAGAAAKLQLAEPPSGAPPDGPSAAVRDCKSSCVMTRDDDRHELATPAQVAKSEPVVTSTQRRPPTASKRIEIRLLVRRREAGALIGKRGANIKRMRDTYKSSSFNIPDTGNGPERVVCITGDSWASLEAILLEIGRLFLDKSALLHLGEEQVELKQLINSAYAGLLIGIGGQSIRKLRNDSRAAIKIYEMCCPLSDERVCAIKARPPVVVSTIRLIHELMLSSQDTIKASLQAHKLYDALNFDPNLVDKYGGFISDEACLLSDFDHVGAAGVGGPVPEPLSYPRHRVCSPGPLAHFNLMGGEPLPLVMPPGFRPTALFAPFQPLDLVSFHPVGECHQNVSVGASRWESPALTILTPNTHSVSRNRRPARRPQVDGCPLSTNGQLDRARFAPRQSDAHSTVSNQERRLRASLAQAGRNQRYHPYSTGESAQSRPRLLTSQQQQQLLVHAHLMERMGQQMKQNGRLSGGEHLEERRQVAELCAGAYLQSQTNNNSHKQPQDGTGNRNQQAPCPRAGPPSHIPLAGAMSAECPKGPTLHSGLARPVQDLGQRCHCGNASGNPRLGLDNHAHQDKSYHAAHTG